MKKIMSVLLTVIMVFSVTIPAFSKEVESRLYNIYGDGMLFEQNEPATFTGVCQSGATIYIELVNSEGKTVADAKTIASKSGTFSASFTAPEGGYTEYAVKCYENNVLFQTLNDVVFGELWLSSGQSNMEYPLASDDEGAKNCEKQVKLNKWLRVFMGSGVTKYKGSTELVPNEYQKEIEDCYWVKGDNANVYNMSAVAYYFADHLIKKLDMPVGILNSSLGGSAIASWIPREAIEGDKAVLNDFISNGTYISSEDWYKETRNQGFDMGGDFNLKIAPLKPFKISGMIWYQGETDISPAMNNNRYIRYFDLMQRYYTEYFGYGKGMLPIIFSSLASYIYKGGPENTLDVPDKNIEFTEIQQARPESRALVSIYDVPGTYVRDLGAIHPSVKRPVGERMGISAMGMVYGKDDAYTTATVKETEIKEGAIYVTFRNVGQGLVAKGELNCFSICGIDGIYLDAKAEIVSKDTVKIYNSKIKEPKSATYAYYISNYDANLYAKNDAGDLIPVSVFITDDSVSRYYYKNSTWLHCETNSSWRVVSSWDMCGNYDTWEAKNADVDIDEFSASEGKNGLHVLSNRGLFGKKYYVMPKTNFHRFYQDYFISDSESNLTHYGKITFSLRNNSKNPVTLSSFRIYIDPVIWYNACIDGKTDSSFTIPADGKWHEITFDLNKLKLMDNNTGAYYTNDKLGMIKYIKLYFENSNYNGADISIDEFSFTPETGKSEIQYDKENLIVAKIFEICCSLFDKVYYLIYDI